MIALQKEKCFLFHLKSSFRPRDIQIFVICPLPFHNVQITLSRLQGQMQVEQFMMSRTGLHNFADVIFGITQKPLYITSSNLFR